MFASFRLSNGESSKIQIFSSSVSIDKYNTECQSKLKYNKVANNRKHKLINLVFGQGISIVQAAKCLHINYSTAKSIIMSSKKNPPISNQTSITSHSSKQFHSNNNNSPSQLKL